MSPAALLKLLMTSHWATCLDHYFLHIGSLLSPNAATRCVDTVAVQSHCSAGSPVELLYKQQFVPAPVGILCALKLLISAVGQTA